MDEALSIAVRSAAEWAARPCWAWSDADLVAAIHGTHAIVTTLTAALASLAREADGRDLPHRDGAASTVSWLRDVLRVAPAEAKQLLSLGTLIDARPGLGDAVTAGVVNAGQALAIGRVVDAAPADDPIVRDKVEVVLIDHATRFEPTILRQLGERALAHIDPDSADRRLGERLDREAARARARRGFTIAADGLGGMRVSGLLDVESAAIVGAALDPLARPVRGDDGPDLRSAAARRADALVDVCRIALASGGLPDDGGQPPQVVVTVDFDALRRDIAVGQLDTGALVSASTVRRMACDAQILPAVLDGASVPIDIGRGRRLYSGTARRAVLLRDGGCAFPGCDRPPRWTQIHHIVSWLDGGPTDRDNGVALCTYHHRVIHHGDWSVHVGDDRRPSFVPPAHIDPQRRPRRNPYHPR
ncbi:MAG TPA: DUF222 domain-containing protein, partial [Micromonosporaceae bacterium]